MIHDLQSTQILLIYTKNHETNVQSRLSSQWLYGNPCTWAYDMHELPQSHSGDNQEGTRISCVLWIAYAKLHYAPWYKQSVTVWVPKEPLWL